MSAAAGRDFPPCVLYFIDIPPLWLYNAVIVKYPFFTEVFPWKKRMQALACV